MIQLVWEQSKKAKNVADVLVATDDIRIFETVHAFGGKAVMTKEQHQSGTDRCFEALSLQNESFDAVVNVQGDEPFIDEKYIDKVAELLKNGAQITTLAHPIKDPEEISNPNKVKVVFSNNKKALYFSRTVIPFNVGNTSIEYFGHIGIYGYTCGVLERITQLESSKLEKAERLEQLRWLENDFSIHLDIVSSATIGIDTPEDLKQAQKSNKN